MIQFVPSVKPQLTTPESIEGMRVAGRMAASCLEMLEPLIQPGVTTAYLDTLCHDYIVDELQAIPACLGYRGYPKTICTSINNVVCHGIPDEKQVLHNGDIVNIDVTVIKDGWHGDTSIMAMVGDVPAFARKLVDVTRECLLIGIKQVKAGAHLGDIGAAITAHAHKNKYSVVRDYCGHGISTTFHEAPEVNHFAVAGTGPILEPGLSFTIEPMINQGKYDTRLLDDGWTVKTKDRKLSAQWEHTLMVTETGCEVFTLRQNEQI